MKKFILSLIIISMVFMFASCTTRLIDYTLISSKNIDLTRLSTFEKGKSRIEGEDRLYVILFIPTAQQVTVKEAMDAAIESVPGAVALVDGVVYFENWSMLLLGSTAFIIEGSPLIDPKLASYQQPESNYMISKLDSNGKVSSVQYVSKEEYESMRAKVFKLQ